MGESLFLSKTYLYLHILLNIAERNIFEQQLCVMSQTYSRMVANLYHVYKLYVKHLWIYIFATKWILTLLWTTYIATADEQDWKKNRTSIMIGYKNNCLLTTEISIIEWVLIDPSILFIRRNYISFISDCE